MIVWDDVIGIGSMALVIAVVVGVSVYAVQSARTQTACLRAGYPSSDLALNLEPFCVKRVDQTDVVVPLKTVLEKQP